MDKLKYLLVLCIITACLPIVTASDIDSAKYTANQINNDLDRKLPYSISLTPQLLESYGYDVQNMSRKGGTYNITIKSATYDAESGVLITYLNANYNGSSLRVKNPVRWYMPFDSGLHGSNANNRIKEYLGMVLSYFEQQPFGDPENDDTLIVYSSNDAQITLADAVRDYSAERDYPTGSSVYSPTTSDSQTFTQLQSNSGKDGFSTFTRFYWTFNTSVVGEENDITSAKFSIYYKSKADTFSGSQPSLNITNGSPSNPLSYTTSDYSKFGQVNIGDGISYSSYGSGWNNISFYTTSFSLINKTGYSVFVLRNSWDVDNVFGGTYADAKTQSFGVVGSTNSSFKPFLTIEYTPPTANPPNASFNQNVSGGNSPLPVAFYDTSTNTPTSWIWYFTNVTGNNTQTTFSTLQNINYTFGIGNFSIRLNATNAAGSNISQDGLHWVNVSGSSATLPVVAYTISNTFVRFPNTITVNDTSLNTPTSWEWYWGDGTSNTTTQNATHQYTKRGKWNITLTATNSAGSNTSDATAMRVFGYETYQ